MSNGITPPNSYITPEQAAMMAGIEDPSMRMNTFGGMQAFANQLPQMGRIRERDNGRVVGRTSAMEGLGQMGSQMAGAYMNKNLMDKYGKVMDQNNAMRMSTAKMIAEALRNAGRGQPQGTPVAAPSAAQAFPVNMQNPQMAYPLDPYEVDGQYGG
jgi:signal recognition particle subunit SEC65